MLNPRINTATNRLSALPPRTPQDDLDDLSYDVPFKAIYSMAEWANVAVNTLTVVNSVLNGEASAFSTPSSTPLNDRFTFF